MIKYVMRANSDVMSLPGEGRRQTVGQEASLIICNTPAFQNCANPWMQKNDDQRRPVMSAALHVMTSTTDVQEKECPYSF